MTRTRVRFFAACVFAGSLTLAGCSHKTIGKSNPAVPPPAPSPTASIKVSPESLQAGQAATLTWSTANATDIQIEGLGVVDAKGSKSVSPGESTTYHLTAKGQSGSADASTRITVTPTPSAATTSPSEEELFKRQVKDLYFEYDKYDVRAADQASLSADADFFKQHVNLRFVIEGHCDERGSEEYNVALGDNRAETAKKQLISMGVDPSRIKIISYGKEKPFCTAEGESCYQQNRRAHFSLDR